MANWREQKSWKEKVKFRDLLSEFNTNADESKEVKRIIPKWVKRFESIESLKHFAPRFKKVKTVAGLDKVLSDVYDYCDANSIWVEM